MTTPEIPPAFDRDDVIELLNQRSECHHLLLTIAFDRRLIGSRTQALAVRLLEAHGVIGSSGKTGKTAPADDDISPNRS